MGRSKLAAAKVSLGLVAGLGVLAGCAQAPAAQPTRLVYASQPSYGWNFPVAAPATLSEQDEGQLINPLGGEMPTAAPVTEVSEQPLDDLADS